MGFLEIAIEMQERNIKKRNGQCIARIPVFVTIPFITTGGAPILLQTVYSNYQYRYTQYLPLLSLCKPSPYLLYLFQQIKTNPKPEPSKMAQNLVIITEIRRRYRYDLRHLPQKPTGTAPNEPPPISVNYLHISLLSKLLYESLAVIMIDVKVVVEFPQRLTP